MLERAHGEAGAGPSKAAPGWAGAGDLGQHSGTSKGSVYHQGQPCRVTLEKRLKSNTGTPGSGHTSKTRKPLATQRRSGESGAQGVCPGTCS